MKKESVKDALLIGGTVVAFLALAFVAVVSSFADEKEKAMVVTPAGELEELEADNP